MQLGYIYAKADKVEDILRRSGHNGATNWRVGFDATTTLIPLPRKMLVAEALVVARRVGDNALGLINEKCGTWSIRIEKMRKLLMTQMPRSTRHWLLWLVHT